MIPKNAKYRIDRGQLFQKDLHGLWQMKINSSNEDTSIKVMGDLVKVDRSVRHFDENGKDIYDRGSDSYDALTMKKESLSNLLENCQKVLILIYQNSKDLDPMFKSSLDALIDNISGELGIKKHTNSLLERMMNKNKVTESNKVVEDDGEPLFSDEHPHPKGNDKLELDEIDKEILEEDGSKKTN